MCLYVYWLRKYECSRVYVGGLKSMKDGDWCVLGAKAERNEAVQLMYVGCCVSNRGWGSCVEIQLGLRKGSQ